jgi:crotonobetaine/carnitine-CoA ligase
MLTLVPTMAFGGTVILIEEYSASRFMRQIRKHKATFTCIVPTILRTLLKQPKRKYDSDHCMRSSFYALPTSREEWEEFENRFKIRLIDGYGLTETFALAIGNPYWGLRKRHCIGLPAVGMEVRLIDENGGKIETFNQPGEILLKGSPIFSGYYKNEEETKKAIDEAGWLHTGDIGYMDPDGYYYFYDRKKEIIKRAGENISTSEVERVLNDHVDIMESAVVGVPDEMRDEAVFAFVVVKNNSLSADDIRNYCREKMSAFKVPQYINVIDQFEKTSIGKIKKNKYKDIAKNIYKSLT